MKRNPSERTPIMEECKTAALEIITDPADKDKQKKIAVQIPCKRIDGEYCSTYLYPKLKWMSGKHCPFAQVDLTAEQEIKINPLKASKRAAGKK